MKIFAASVFTGIGFILMSGVSRGQGVLGVNALADYWEDIPFSLGVSVQGGWDSNIDVSQLEEQDSTYVSADVNLAYGSTGSRNNIRIGATFGVTHYLDAPETVDETSYNAGAFVNFTRQLTPRMEFSNNLYVSYEVEPDYLTGGTTARRDGQYVNMADRVALSYAWTRRFSTTVAYHISGIIYEDSALSATEDRFNHEVGFEGRYHLTDRTSLHGEYRYRITDYQNLGSDVTSHLLLVGLQHAFSPRLTGTVKLGAQYYDSDRISTVAPYLEASLAYRVSKRTNVQWFNRLGFEGAELGFYDSRYAFRTGLSASHRFSERLSGNVGVFYSYSIFDLGDGVSDERDRLRSEADAAREDAIAAAEAVGLELTDEQLAVFELDEDALIPSDDTTEHQISMGLGLAYRLFANVDLNAGYSYTMVESDTDYRDYERHRVYMGIGALF